MSSDKFVVDVCKEADPAKLTSHIAASKAYWTSDAKGYELVSDDEGTDKVRCFESSIDTESYDEGIAKYAAVGEVILVYKKST